MSVFAPVFRILSALAVLAALSLQLSGVALARTEKLVFGLIPPENSQTIQKLWQPLLEDMSKALGIPVEGKVFEDYAGVIWSLGSGKVQLAWMGNKAAAEAVDRAGAEVGLITLGDHGQEGYRSHVIVPADSPLSSIDDLLRSAPSLSFGIGDPNSASGTLVPGYFIFSKRGLSPDTLFKRLVPAHHEENFRAVAEGRLDAATNNSVGMTRYAQRHPELFKRVRVIWTSPLIPNSPIVWRKSLPQGDKDRIRAFLAGYGRPAPDKTPEQLQREKATLAALKWSGFKASDDSQLNPIRQMELFKLRQQVEADATMAPAEKEHRLQGIDVGLKGLKTGSEEAPQ